MNYQNTDQYNNQTNTWGVTLYMYAYISSIFSPVNNKLWHFVNNSVSENKITLNFTHDIYFQFNSFYTLCFCFVLPNVTLQFIYIFNHCELSIVTAIPTSQ